MIFYLLSIYFLFIFQQGRNNAHFTGTDHEWSGVERNADVLIYYMSRSKKYKAALFSPVSWGRSHNQQGPHSLRLIPKGTQARQARQALIWYSDPCNSSDHNVISRWWDKFEFKLKSQSVDQGYAQVQRWLCSDEANLGTSLKSVITLVRNKHIYCQVQVCVKAEVDI